MSETMTQSLKSAYDDSAMSVRRLAKKSNVPYSIAHRAIKDGKNITVSTYEKLANTLGLQTVRDPGRWSDPENEETPE